MLTQTWANPAQNLGRIKIVIAEGINHGPGLSAFERTKNLVSFSFQHAPLRKMKNEHSELLVLTYISDILENCGIAWPNQGLYFQAAQQFHNMASPQTQAADPDMHAHSPRRRRASMVSARAKQIPATGPLPMQLPGYRHPGVQNEDPFWSQYGPTSDLFTGGAKAYHYRNPWSRSTTTSGDVSMKDRSRTTSDNYDEAMADVTRPASPATSRRSHAMPDYSRPQSLASSRQVSWYTGEDSIGLKVSQLEEVVEDVGIEERASEIVLGESIDRMSPREFSVSSGITAPSNTRVNSAANTPPGNFSKPSMAAELRAASFAGVPRSQLPFNTRLPSNNNVLFGADSPRPASRQSEEIHDEIGEETDDKSRKRPVGRPAGSVKSRKEGRTSELGLEVLSSKSQRRASAPSTSAIGKENSGGATGEKSGEGKRKRGTKFAASKVIPKDSFSNPDSSPSRKLSKLSPEDTMHRNEEIEYVISPPVLLPLDDALRLRRILESLLSRNTLRLELTPWTGDADCETAI